MGGGLTEAKCTQRTMPITGVSNSLNLKFEEFTDKWGKHRQEYRQSYIKIILSNALVRTPCVY